ncbi:hypothetical protein [Chryseobacterium lactis]|nr:hypothetical protein [Chryseobacterium lactis]
MKIRRIGAFLLVVFVMSIIIFVFELNTAKSDNGQNLSKTDINHLLFWSFIKSFVMSLAIFVTNYFNRGTLKSKNLD